MVRAVTADSEREPELPNRRERVPLRWRSLVLIARPRQWIKNLLVLAAPGAAGVLSHRHEALLALGTVGIFCLTASGTYFLNDTFDAAADRLHPIKRLRPVAAGDVSVPVAVTIGAVLLCLGFALSWVLAGDQLAAVVAVYSVIAVAYSIRLKHVPVIDLACVSSGFILRAIAGGVACAVPLSNYFLLVASFGALLVVAGKRSAEHADLGEERALHRPTLGAYPAAFLRSVRLIAAAVTVTSYCLWAFERSRQIHQGQHPIWFQLSIVPFVLAILHVELRFESGHGSAPEELALGDHTLQLLGLAWVVLFAVGVYG
jgi:decaprenyl-phosphate phosphoribosyltransferase